MISLNGTHVLACSFYDVHMLPSSCAPKRLQFLMWLFMACKLMKPFFFAPLVADDNNPFGKWPGETNCTDIISKGSLCKMYT